MDAEDGLVEGVGGGRVRGVGDAAAEERDVHIVRVEADNKLGEIAGEGHERN